MVDQNKIDEKLLLYLLNEVDDIERNEVERWLNESEDNQKYFKEFQKVHLKLPMGNVRS